MDYLPKLAHDGHNWTAYGSLVLCAIIDNGLMGLLVGSETRPIHPAELDGRGEGWTPRTGEERDEVAAWKAADQSWTQRNAMVNYTIVSSIPDTIFGCMLHLKSPLEQWDYLEKRFGSIPRPESWVAAEEAMRQSDSQPEQSTAGETTQSTRDSHDEPSNPPSEEADSPDSPNDCAETKSRYLTPETEVVDARQIGLYLPVVEVGTVNSKQPDERDHTGVASTSIPANTVAAEQPTVVLHERTEIAYGHMAPEATIVDVQSQVAGSCAANSNESKNDWTEIPTGYLEPETDIVDVQRTELDEQVHTLKPTDQRSQCAADEVAGDQRSPEWISEASEPADDATRYSCGHSIENASTECNEHILMDGKTIADVPDPPGIHAEPPAPYTECSTLQNRPSARMCSATSMEFNLSPATRHEELQETRYLELDSKWASRHPRPTCRRHSASDTPPDEVWGVGVHKHARTGRRDSADIRSTTTKREIRATSAQMVDTRAHVSKRPTAPDKGRAGTSRFDDAVSRDLANSQRVEKAMLAHSRSQYTKREAKWLNSLPVSPTQPPNGITDTPRTSRVPHRHCRVNTTPVNVRGLKTRGYRRLILNVPVSLPCEVSKHLWNIADTFWKQDMPHRRTRNHDGPSDSRTAVSRQRHETTRQDGECARLGQHGTPAIPLVLPWEWTEWNNWENDDATSSNAVCLHGAEKELLADSRSQHTRHEAKRQDGLPATPKPPQTGIPHLTQPYRLPRGRGRIKRTAESVSNAQTRQNAYCVQAAPKRSLLPLFAPSKRSLDPAGGSWMMNIRCNEVRHVRRVETRGRTHRTSAGILMQLIQILLKPTKRSLDPAGGSSMINVRYNEVRVTGNVQMRGYLYPGEHTQGSATISPSRQPRKRRKPPWDIAGTYQRQGVPHPWIWGNDEPLYGQNGGLSITVQGQSARTTSAFPKREVATTRRINTTKQHSLYTRTRSSLAAEYTLVY